MFNFISKLLYSLKSENAKRKEMEKAFAAVGQPPKPSLGERIRGFIAEHWKFLLTFSASVVGIGIAIAKYLP